MHNTYFSELLYSVGSSTSHKKSLQINRNDTRSYTGQMIYGHVKRKQNNGV